MTNAKQASNILFLAAFLLAIGSVSSASEKQEARSGNSEKPISPIVRNNVKVAYQIKTNEQKTDVAAGLHYLRKLVAVYDELGIESEDRHIVGVFHGPAGHFLLKDAAFEAAVEKSDSNPNKAIIRELLNAGVSLELCKSTMRQNGWVGSDVLPGIDIVVGAYPRIIDLQLRGYAYIKL